MSLRLRNDDGPNNECWLGSSEIIEEIRTIIALRFSRWGGGGWGWVGVGGPDSLYRSESAHAPIRYLDIFGKMKF